MVVYNGCSSITSAAATLTVNPPLTLSATGQAFAAIGGSSTVKVIGLGCSWYATSNVAWITITNGFSGVGNGTVNYSVSANTSPARTGTMTIAGTIFTVTQQGAANAVKAQ